MKTNRIIVVILVVLVLFFWWDFSSKKEDLQNVTNPPKPDTISNGLIEWMVPDGFGLAVNADQLLKKTYIPQCDQGFDYCIYYLGEGFENTNFESAGVRIKKRGDLISKSECLYGLPQGYDSLNPIVINHENYSTSVFAPIGGAGAGHYSNGKLYRIYIAKSESCVEVETRIGETQFVNYPEGTIKQFGPEDRKYLFSRFDTILNSLKISSTSEPIDLPSSVI